MRRSEVLILVVRYDTIKLHLFLKKNKQRLGNGSIAGLLAHSLSQKNEIKFDNMGRVV